MHYAGQAGGLVLELYPSAPGGDAGQAPGETVMLGFSVASLDETLGSLSVAGATFKSPPRETGRGRRAVMLDPDGRAVELLELSPSPADS